MAVSPASYSNLDLTMSLHSSARDLDLNQVPSLGSEDKWITKTTTVEVFDEENIDGVVRPKKLRLTRKQSRLLEESFRQNNTLKPKQKQALALQLKLKPRQVEVWFQNRRARSKLKETEMECENLKRLLGSLTEQNLQLEAEVEKLKAMKAGSPTVISPHSFEPSTLKIMCPRCVCVTTISSINMEPSTPLSSKVVTSALQSWPSSAAC